MVSLSLNDDLRVDMDDDTEHHDGMIWSFNDHVYLIKEFFKDPYIISIIIS